VGAIAGHLATGTSLGIISSLTWDGNIGNRDFITLNEDEGSRAVLVHISDEVPSLPYPAVISATSLNEESMTIETQPIIAYANSEDGFIIYTDNEDSDIGVWIIPDTMASAIGISGGIYFMAYQVSMEGLWIPMMWTSSLYLLGHSLSSMTGTGNGITYTLSKDGSTIKLIGSDGSETNVTDGIDVAKAYTDEIASALNEAIAKKSDSGHTHSAATTSTAGFMSAVDKSKLDGIAYGAKANVQSDWNATSGDAYILNKPNIKAGSGSGSIV
jgi:hypothetical protein